MNEMSKFARYRARKKARGLREIRLWIPDVRTPAFQAQARNEAKILRGAPEEQETLNFIEAVMADTMKDDD